MKHAFVKTTVMLSWLAFALFAFVACGDDSESLDEEIECTTIGQTRCNTANELYTCGANKRWIVDDCEDICEALLSPYSGECGYDETREQPFCLCFEGEDEGGEDDDDDALDDEDALESVCSDTFEKCEEGHLDICGEAEGFETFSCRARCEAEGKFFGACILKTAPILEACVCSEEEEHSLCQQTKPTCVSGEIALCEAGKVVLTDCDTLCEKEGLASEGCALDEDRGHGVCRCAP